MSEGRIALAIEGPFARVTIDNVASRNALTFAMYDQLLAACATIASSLGLRAVLLTGAGGNFCAGTDIAEFLNFAGGADGVRYEQRVETVLRAIESLPVPTVAAVDGVAMGGGVLVAAACDFRVVSTTAKFGAPVARTLGNGLSLRNVARLERSLGLAVVRRVLLLAGIVDAAEAVSAGFAVSQVPPEELISHAQELLDTLATNAPLTIASTRAALARLVRDVPDDSDALRAIYDSADFREGVRAFLDKRKPHWTGA